MKSAHEKNNLLFPLIVMLFLTFSAYSSVAANFKDLSVNELDAMIQAGDTIVLLNPLSDIEFNEKHIPGSVNIPVHQINGSKMLPEDKSTPIITYCLGPK